MISHNMGLGPMDTITNNTSSMKPGHECQWCGLIHGPQCPSVKAIEFFENGMVRRVEYKTAADYPPATPAVPENKTVTVTWPQTNWQSYTSGHSQN